MTKADKLEFLEFLETELMEAIATAEEPAAKAKLLPEWECLRDAASDLIEALEETL